MTYLLHIKASPSPTSRSDAVAQAFLAEYRRAAPTREVRSVDVWQADLPAFDATMIEAKFAVLRRNDATPEQRAQWAQAVAHARLFNEAAQILISTPMWNFGLPYRLKHYIDVVTLPEQNWRWTPAKGYEPLLSGQRAAIVYSSAGDYPLQPVQADSDFQKPFLRRWLAFVGITEVDEVRIAPTLADPALVQEAQQAAVVRAAELGHCFALAAVPG